MASTDEYIQQVIAKGDEGSALLRARTVETLKNSGHVKIVDDKAVVHVPEDHVVVVHAATGNPIDTDPESHARSLVINLLDQANHAGITPVGFANIVDSQTGDLAVIEKIAEGLDTRLVSSNVAILNGENAILGPIVNGVQANIAGAMISIAPKESDFVKKSGNRNNLTIPGASQRIEYAIFDPQGQAVYINADGVGTKTKFYEMTGQYHLAIDDLFAMNLDDAIKAGAIPKVVAVMAEFTGQPNDEELIKQLEKRASECGVIPIYTSRNIGKRLAGFKEGVLAFNLNGAVVSTIDEDRLKNPLQSYEGDTVIAIRGQPNPRSNGISSKRKAMDMIGAELTKLSGADHYSETEVGKHFLEFLAQPSTILYPVFRRLIDEQAATNVYHMSGGAFNSKLAKPLVDAGLYVELTNLFPPDPREETLRQVLDISQRDAYGQWPMGNDGFITTKTPGLAIAIITAHGLEGKVVGKVERRTEKGLLLTTPSGETVYFWGGGK